MLSSSEQESVMEQGSELLFSIVLEIPSKCNRPRKKKTDQGSQIWKEPMKNLPIHGVHSYICKQSEGNWKFLSYC